MPKHPFLTVGEEIRFSLETPRSVRYDSSIQRRLQDFYTVKNKVLREKTADNPQDVEAARKEIEAFQGGQADKDHQDLQLKLPKSFHGDPNTVAFDAPTKKVTE